MDKPIVRVAVTGAAGYIGRKLVQRLENEASLEQLLVIDVRPLRRQSTPRVVVYQRDITADLAEILAQHDVKAVVHLAFLLNPGHDRKASRRVNVGGMANVLDACARAGVQHLVYLSSATVYGAHPDNPSLLTEESPVKPVKGFGYGEDKSQAELLIQEFLKQKPDFTATVLRACPVMGPSADNFISRAFTKPFLVGVGGYDPPMQLLHEDDLLDIMALCTLKRASGVYNLAGGGSLPWSEMVSIFRRRLINLPAPLLYGLTGLTWGLRLQNDSPACGLDFIRYPWTVSTEKAERELGIRPRYSSREAWEAFARGRQLSPAGTGRAR